MSEEKTQEVRGQEIPKLFSEAEVAQYLKISIRTLRNLRKRGCGPAPVKIGRFIRYTDRAIQYFIGGCKASEQTPAA